MKIDEPRTRRFRRCRAGRIFPSRFVRSLAQFAQSGDKPGLQPDEFHSELGVRLVQIGVVPGEAGLRIVEGKPRHDVPALVAKEFRPERRVGLLGAQDKNAAALARPRFDLFAKPFELVLAPARLEIAVGHHDHQHAGGARLRPQFFGELRRRVDQRVHPETKLIEFRLKRMKLVLELSDERPGPVPQRRAAANRIAMRIADEDVGIEIRV